MEDAMLPKSTPLDLDRHFSQTNHLEWWKTPRGMHYVHAPEEWGTSKDHWSWIMWIVCGRFGIMGPWTTVERSLFLIMYPRLQSCLLRRYDWTLLAPTPSASSESI